MKIPEPEQIGEVSVYGEWDDVTDHQFLVVWGEAGDTCTVIALSGYDYGGGVQCGSANVPLKKMEEIINKDWDWMGSAKSAVIDLIKEYK